MADYRIRTLAFGVLCLVITGCSGPDYDPEKFSEFKNDAESDPQGAVDDLKRFVHANPEHPQALLLLGRTLLETAGSDEEQIYVARYYLKRSMQQDVNEEVAEQASNAYMQARLTQDSDAGGPEAVVDLAEYATDTRPARAAELYLRAARDYLQQGKAAEAVTPARTARSLILEMSPQQSNAHDHYLARWILASINTRNGDYEDASKRLKAMEAMDIDPEEWEKTPEYLPGPSFLSAANAFIAEAAGDGMLSSVTDSVSRLWSDGSDDGNQEAALEEAMIALEEADRSNRRIDDAVRDRLSGRVWAKLHRNIAERHEKLREEAEQNARFYFRRAGDEVALEELG